MAAFVAGGLWYGAVGIQGTIVGVGVRLCRIDRILRDMDEILESEDY